MNYIILLLVGYLIGSIQVPIIAGRLLRNIDIREHGSGNAGSTNVARVLGLKVAIAVFILDICKGLVPFLVARHFLGVEVALVLGLGTILGHNFPIFMKFKGGKGVAIGLGMITAYNVYIGLAIFVAAVIIVGSTKYVSLASIVGACIALVSVWFVLDVSLIEQIVITIIASLLIFQHRGNIKRLIKGKENKLTFKKSE